MSYVVRTQRIDTDKILTQRYDNEADAVQRWIAAEQQRYTAPLSLTTDALEREGIVLDADDVQVVDGGFEVDGMTLDDWAHAMTME